MPFYVTSDFFFISNETFFLNTEYIQCYQNFLLILPPKLDNMNSWSGFHVVYSHWLNRVARFIFREASFWLSNFFGLEMGTRFCTEKRVLLLSKVFWPEKGARFFFIPGFSYTYTCSQLEQCKWYFPLCKQPLTSHKSSIISHMRIINQLYGWL